MYAYSHDVSSLLPNNHYPVPDSICSSTSLPGEGPLTPPLRRARITPSRSPTSQPRTCRWRKRSAESALLPHSTPVTLGRCWEIGREKRLSGRELGARLGPYVKNAPAVCPLEPSEPCCTLCTTLEQGRIRVLRGLFPCGQSATAKPTCFFVSIPLF